MLARKLFCNYIAGMAKKRIGRPPLEPGESKSQVFQIRLTEAEREQYQSAADRANKPLAAWIRDCLGRAAKKPKKG